MESRRKIRVMYRKCSSIKEVSRNLGISIPTVRKIVKSEESLPVSYKRDAQFKMKAMCLKLLKSINKVEFA